MTTDLSTNVLLGKGRLYWLDVVGKKELGIMVGGEPLMMHQHDKLHSKVGHLFVRRSDGARSSLGAGRILFSDRGFKLMRTDTGFGSAFYRPHVDELIPQQKGATAPIVEIYFHPGGTV